MEKYITQAKPYLRQLRKKRKETVVILGFDENEDFLFYRDIGFDRQKHGCSYRNGDIVKYCNKFNCNKVLLSHNHTNGNPVSSDKDDASTNEAIAYLSKHDITLLDHIVVSACTYFSIVKMLVV